MGLSHGAAIHAERNPFIPPRASSSQACSSRGTPAAPLPQRIACAWETALRASSGLCSRLTAGGLTPIGSVLRGQPLGISHNGGGQFRTAGSMPDTSRVAHCQGNRIVRAILIGGQREHAIAGADFGPGGCVLISETRQEFLLDIFSSDGVLSIWNSSYWPFVIQNATWRPAPIMVLSGPLIPADRVADMSRPSRWVRARLRLAP